MMLSKKLVSVSLLVLLTLSGCVIASTADLSPQSHFDFPNSNVTAIGPAKGEATNFRVFVPSNVDANLEETAYQRALQQTGGDMLIDMYKTSATRMINLMYLQIYWTTLTVEGTAAKMEIGKQKLK